MVINRQLREMHEEVVNANEERRKARRVAKVRMARLSIKTKNLHQPPRRSKKMSSQLEESITESSGADEDWSEGNKPEEEPEEDKFGSGDIEGGKWEEDELKEDELEEDELEEDN